MKTLFSIIAFTCATTSINAQPGAIDTSFGNKGKTFDTTIWADCTAMALQADGKILTGGYSDTITELTKVGGFYIGRYNTDGSIDKEFGVNGKTIIRNIQGALAAWPKTIIVQPDNKILVLGRFVPDALYGDVGLIRFLSDGRVDSSFGTNGFVLTKVSTWDDVLGGMVLQPDGRIVVAGNKQSAPSQPGPDFVLRYMTDGSADKSFGDNGIVLTSYNSNVTLGAIALQTDGKILTGGTYGVTTRRFQVVRYNTNGSLDESFGIAGIATLIPELSDRSGIKVNSITIQPDKKIIIAGAGNGYRMAMARFDGAGTADLNFGNKGGYTILPMSEGGAEGKSVFYISSSKKIILTGHYYITVAEQVAAVQYNENGTLDSSFGENGVAVGGFADNKYGSDITSGVGLLQPDGKMIVSGSFLQDDNKTYNVALFRFNGDIDRTTKYVRIKKWLHRQGFTWEDWPGKDVNYYAVERSGNGSSFTEIARLFNRNNQQQFNYADEVPLTGDNYYRLAAVSTDGSTTYSNVLTIPNNTAAIKVYPNPAKNNLVIEGLAATEKTTLVIADLNGTTRMNAVANGSTYNWNIATLKPGNYILRITNGSNVITKKFFKE